MKISNIKRYKTTTKGLQDLQRHLDSLCERRARLSEELRDLVSQNDVRNVMYDYAQTASHSQMNEVENEINALKRILSGAVIVTPPADKVGLGSRVTIAIGGTKRTYTIVGYIETDPLNGKISDESPFGKALMGRKVGETFELALNIHKKQTATIISIGKSKDRRLPPNNK